jgi:sulfur carrier protein ThiS
MHRGSSKDGRDERPPSETLPLSASPRSIVIEVEIVRAAASRTHRLEVPFGTRLRDAIRSLAGSPEGYAVLVDGTSVPADLSIEIPTRFVVVPTFSGG